MWIFKFRFRYERTGFNMSKFRFRFKEPELGHSYSGINRNYPDLEWRVEKYAQNDLIHPEKSFKKSPIRGLPSKVEMSLYLMWEYRKHFGLVACGCTFLFWLSNPAFVSLYSPQFHLFRHSCTNNHHHNPPLPPQTFRPLLVKIGGSNLVCWLYS